MPIRFCSQSTNLARELWTLIAGSQGHRAFQRATHGVSARFLQSCSNIHGDEKLILNNEDRTTPESGVVHNGTYARLSANARGGLDLMGPQGPEPSINPQRATSVMIDWQKAMSA